MRGSPQQRATWKASFALLALASVFAVGGWTVWSLSGAVLPAVPSEPQTMAYEVTTPPIQEEPMAAIPTAASEELTSATSEEVRQKTPPTGKDHDSPQAMLMRMIAQLHAEASNQFNRAPGNGFNREIPLMKMVIANRPWKTLDWTSEELAKEPPPPKEERDLTLLHRISENRFAESNTKTPAERQAAEAAHRLVKKEYRWEIKSLDLVGLLMHESPVVYVSETIPEMKDLKTKPIRELDLFESEGLEELVAGKKLYVRSKDETIRVLGPIHAGKACLKCHRDSKEGDMLGAFSYTLRVAHISWVRVGAEQPRFPDGKGNPFRPRNFDELRYFAPAAPKVGPRK